MMRYGLRAAALVACLGMAEASASGPMIVDDARIVDAKACQLESWWRRDAPVADSYWAQFACNPTGNLELGVGGVRASGAGDGLIEKLVQAKTVLRALDDAWGAGLVAGTVIHTRDSRARRWPGDPYVYVPVTFRLRGDDWLVHVNAGAARDADAARTVATAGVGTEARIARAAYLVAETNVADRGHPFWQAGVRYSVAGDRVQIAATYGDRLAPRTSERWFTIGLRLLSPPFLP